MPSFLYPLSDFASKYSEVLRRSAVTLAMLAVMRAGMFIPLPGLDQALLTPMDHATEGERMIRALYGQAQALPASLFDLGISPYINASIVITVLMVLPKELFSWQWLAQLKESRKEGKAGEAHITTWINGLSLILAVYLAVLRAVELEPAALFSSGFIPGTALALVAGSCVVQFCANMITAHGVGNGSSLVICTGIVTEYAKTLHSIATGLETGGLAPGKLGLVSLGYLSLVLFSVYLSSSQLRLPVVQYSTAAPGNGPAAGTFNDMFAQARQVAVRKAAQRSTRTEYFPLQLSSQGMMPMIFAGALYFGFMPKALSLIGWGAAAAALAEVQGSYLGLLFYGALVFCMEFVPVGGVNPKEAAEYFGLMNVGIKGVVPGESTEQHIQAQLLKCKFWGGIALGTLAVAAMVFDTMCQSFLGTTLATTSLLIIVGAVMQTSRQVESLLEGPRLQEKLAKEQALIQSLRSL
ncbi:hypothetical protein FOA52_011236 [Chlamydomonas sp. UWO 241]|nr:hypothetical protein FOA52_011236 [Chlamydomonas sp. UWO 241]